MKDCSIGTGYITLCANSCKDENSVLKEAIALADWTRSLI